MFHPFELAFCGLSGSGKTTLLDKVIRHFSRKGNRIAYFKHGCHHFDIDREGKDSFLARQAGAATVMISDPEKEAIISTGAGSLSSHPSMLSSDILFIEGLKELPIPKILVIDQGKVILEHLERGTVTNVVALAWSDSPEGLEQYGLPCFSRDDEQGIATFIESWFRTKADANALYGLVLTGGKSSRMGTDKALLNYHGETQLERTACLLSTTCRKVFVSCRQEQAPQYSTFGIPPITDSYLDLGPLGGLLSAQREHPDAAWLIAACDMPLLDHDTLRTLAGRRNPFTFATAFRDPASGHPEPLLSIYEPKSRLPLLLQHAQGNNSLSSFLRHSRITITEPANASALHNINNNTDMLQLWGRS